MKTKIAKYKSRLVLGFEHEATAWILCEGLVSLTDHHRGEWTMRVQPSSVSQHSWSHHLAGMF